MSGSLAGGPGEEATAGRALDLLTLPARGPEEGLCLSPLAGHPALPGPAGEREGGLRDPGEVISYRNFFFF